VAVETERQATLVDVARRAKVSYQTVSRVINGHPNVAPATRERILGAIEELNYLPNAAARNLVTRRSRTVGIVSYGSTYYGPAQMVTHIEASFRAREYGLTLSTLPEMTLAALHAAILELRGRFVDGIVMITPLANLETREIQALCRNVPFVMIDIALGEPLPSVVIDQRSGGMLAARHLLTLGHRELAEIRGPRDWSAAAQRHEGLIAVLDEAGLTPTMSVEGDWTAASGYAAAGRILDAGAPFSGLFASNDQMALGAMRALRERGLGVPEDVSIVGFDDLPESAYFEPPLTTVHQDFASLGRESAAYLNDLIDGRPTPLMQHVLVPELVVRRSTRPWG
jgi:DNA-binding LacI/PurR family transcriptional regulator